MKIHIAEPDGLYKCVIDTEVMNVTLRDVFLGVLFETEKGEKLAVSMRDGGFEVHYFADFGEEGFDAGWTEFQNGSVNLSERNK